jgi:hypothetical protein
LPTEIARQALMAVDLHAVEHHHVVFGAGAAHGEFVVVIVRGRGTWYPGQRLEDVLEATCGVEDSVDVDLVDVGRACHVAAPFVDLHALLDANRRWGLRRLGRRSARFSRALRRRRSPKVLLPHDNPGVPRPFCDRETVRLEHLLGEFAQATALSRLFFHPQVGCDEIAGVDDLSASVLQPTQDLGDREPLISFGRLRAGHAFNGDSAHAENRQGSCKLHPYLGGHLFVRGEAMKKSFASADELFMPSWNQNTGFVYPTIPAFRGASRPSTGHDREHERRQPSKQKVAARDDYEASGR